MALDPDILEESFDLLAPQGDQLVEVFYERLFDEAPAVRPLFAESDMPAQRAKLLATLVLLRKSLRNLGAIVPKLRELGARHVAWGARPEHYPVVGEVLVASMAEVAGDSWLPAYGRAWGEAIAVVAGAMLEGAEAARLEGAA
jgi:methyl-accepting chemotaxis protein